MFSGVATQRRNLAITRRPWLFRDSQWHNRSPFFCRRTEDVEWVQHPANAGPLWFNHPFSQQLLQSMDQELRFASDAGIDFFVYHGPAGNCTQWLGTQEQF